MNSRRLSAQRYSWQLVIGACMLAGAAAAVGQNMAVAPSHPAEARACSPCHSAAVKSFAENPHALALPHGAAKPLHCASCHGSQTSHVENGGSTAGMVDAMSVSGAEADRVCLNCHAGKHAMFAHSAHGRHNIGCLSCHSIHSAGAPKYLLKAGQTELCYKCHAEVRPQFLLPSRHNVEEGLVQCTDCHDPHGTRQDELAGAANRQDAFCTDCHTAAAGPFVFEHAVMKAEGCTACHLPHGGPYPHLLLRANVDTICQVCHFPAPDPPTGAHMQAGKDHAGSSKSCTDCHADVHGSNRSPAFLQAP